MVFVLKKNIKNFKPKAKPEIVMVPKANYIAVRGSGNPNDKDEIYLSDVRRVDASKWKTVIHHPIKRKQM